MLQNPAETEYVDFWKALILIDHNLPVYDHCSNSGESADIPEVFVRETERVRVLIEQGCPFQRFANFSPRVNRKSTLRALARAQMTILS